jgi:hypothetical protein
MKPIDASRSPVCTPDPHAWRERTGAGHVCPPWAPRPAYVRARRSGDGAAAASACSSRWRRATSTSGGRNGVSERAGSASWTVGGPADGTLLLTRGASGMVSAAARAAMLRIGAGRGRTISGRARTASVDAAATDGSPASHGVAPGTFSMLVGGGRATTGRTGTGASGRGRTATGAAGGGGTGRGAPHAGPGGKADDNGAAAGAAEGGVGAGRADGGAGGLVVTVAEGSLVGQRKRTCTRSPAGLLHAGHVSAFFLSNHA